MTHNTVPLLEDVRSSLSKTELRATSSTAIILITTVCLLLISTWLSFIYPISIESCLLCVSPHVFASLAYMLLSDRELCLGSVIPFISGAAWTVIVSCLLTITEIDPLLDTYLTKGSLAYSLVFSFVRAGLIEEAVKLHVALDSGLESDFLYSAITGALGFSSAENMQYMLTRSASVNQLVARLITANVVHVGCTVLIVLLGMRLKSRGGWVLAFSLGVCLHGLYDLCVFSTVPVAAVLVVQVVGLSALSLSAVEDLGLVDACTYC